MPRPFLKTRAKETRSTARPRQVQGQVDVPFMLLTVLLVVIGLIMLLSASYPSAYYDLKGNTGGDPFYYFKRQAVYALLGFGIMYLVSRLNYQGLRGLAVTILVVACLLIWVISDPFKGLIYSQMILSIQLPFTVFLQVYLTSSERVMGKYKNSTFTKYLLYAIGGVVTLLNVMLLVSMF